MIEILADFLAGISSEDARATAHFIRGEIAPPYSGIELGMSRQFVIRALAKATNRSVDKITKRFHRMGDLGNVAADLLGNRRGSGLLIHDAFLGLQKIAEATGTGSQEKKIQALALLISRCSALEARYLIRFVMGTLRLGVAEMTFLSALSKAFTGTKENKTILESAFNVLSDLGEVAYQAVAKGVDHLKHARPVVGVPVRMMLAQRVHELEEVQQHIPGAVFVEYKYDGERIQAHIPKKGKIVLYSRRQEDITHQFPDVVEAIRNNFQGKEAIVEGEVVAIDKRTGRFKTFQTLMQRRRKHRVAEYAKQIPVRYFLFDLLYGDGKSYLEISLSRRKKVLAEFFPINPKAIVSLASFIIANRPEKIEPFFLKVLQKGGEGVVIKDAGSRYEPGTRGWKWIKFKKEYRSELADTFDLVVVGALYGTGRRAGTYGSLLVAAYEPKTGTYYSFTKVGTGFSDEDFRRLPALLNKFRLKEKHRLVDTAMRSDVWFEPKLVMEVTGAEITISPRHTVARDKLKKVGLALRFPRFLRWRDDKSAEQATNVSEIYQLFKK